MPHLGSIVGSKEETFEMTVSSNGPHLDEVLKGQAIKGPLGASRTLCSLVYIFGLRIGPTSIITGSTSVLVVVHGLEPLEALCLGVVNILGEGNKSRRRGSIGSRHFVWRMGRWCKAQWLTLLLAAHVRHGLIWSSPPLPQDSSVHQPDKPWIFFIHSVLTPFGVWCYFIFI